MNRPLDDLAPEDDNSEQRDEGQAQDVAADAMVRGTGLYEDSDKAESDPGELFPEDTPDLVDKMNEMLASGIIDNGAYAGEPMHDDQEDILGQTDDDSEE